MLESLRALLSDPWTYGFVAALGVVLGLIRLYLERRIVAGVDHRFAERLEAHKQSLQMTADVARYELEKDLSLSNLYTANQHVAAVEVYRAIRQAHGYCANLRGVRQQLTFEEFNRADLAAHMTRFEVPQGKQDEVLVVLGQDRSAAIENMREYLRLMEVQRAESKLGEAKNATYLNELYFEDATIDVIDSFFRVLDDWMAYIVLPAKGEAQGDLPHKDSLDEALEAVQVALRAHLQGSGSHGADGKLRPPRNVG